MVYETDPWPRLPLDAWQDTYATLHLWTQIVGKIRLTQMPWINHSWHVTLYVTARGLTTSPMPYGSRTFQIDFDFLDHRLLILTSDGTRRALDLKPQSVAAFYAGVLTALEGLGLPVTIYAKPNEVEAPIPFAEDRVHTAYDAEYAQHFWRVLVQADRVFRQFRAHFIGKCSPVHFFWGGFDLAVTRFSGRAAPPHPGGIPHLPDWITREAYSHEVSSCGFWPGGGPHPFPLFYSYVYPEPAGFRAAPVQPNGAFYSAALREFVLPYDEVCRAASPDALLRDFLQSTYEAAAELAQWDRRALERDQHPRHAA
jgi:hypothetical protein